MNNWSITGNLGRDCRVGNAGGTAVCNFAVAVKSGFGNNEHTIWVDCAMWGKKAEGGLPGYLVKGQQVAVSGEVGTREHEGKTYITLRVTDVDLVGGKPQGQQAPQQGGKLSQPPVSQQAPQQQQPQGGGGLDNFDDDIPFN